MFPKQFPTQSFYYQTPRDKLREQLRNPIVWMIISGILIILIIVVFLCNVVFRKNPYGPEIRITNLGDYVKGMPRPTRDAMHNIIYNRVRSDLGQDAQIDGVVAKVASQPVPTNFDEHTKVHRGAILIDIEALRLSYYIDYGWTDDADSDDASATHADITCPPPTVSANFGCDRSKDFTASDEPAAIIVNSTPFYSELESGEAYMIISRYYNGGAVYAELSVESCGNDKIRIEAEKTAKQWMSSVGIPENVIPLETRELCDGGD